MSNKAGKIRLSETAGPTLSIKVEGYEEEVNIGWLPDTGCFSVEIPDLSSLIYVYYSPIAWHFHADLWKLDEADIDKVRVTLMPALIEAILGNEYFVGVLESWRKTQISRLQEEIPQKEAGLRGQKELLKALQMRGPKEPGIGALGQIHDYLVSIGCSEEAGRRKLFLKDILESS